MQTWLAIAAWSAIAAAILTVTGLITLLAFFGTGSAPLGTLNDLNTIVMAIVTVPVALALYPSRDRPGRGSEISAAFSPRERSKWPAPARRRFGPCSPPTRVPRLKTFRPR